MDLQSPLYVVKDISSDDGIGGKSSKTYKYDGAKVHREGKGFLGYAGIMVTDNNTNIINCVENEINEDYYFSFVLSESSYDWPNLLSKTYYQNEVYDFGAKRIFSFTPVSLSHIYRAGDEGAIFVKSQRTDNIYNAEDIIYGNLSEQMVYSDPEYKTFNDLVETYDFATYSFFSYKTENNHWLINRPDTIEIHKFTPGQPVDLSLTHFQYYEYGEPNFPQLKSTGTIPNNAELLEIKNGFTYDDYGNVISETLSAPHYLPALASRTEYYEYSQDYEHRFLTRKYSIYNNVNHSNQFTFDPSTGNLLTSTDENGHITNYRYGIMGNLEKTTLPDGHQICSVIKWAGDELIKPVNGLYYSWTKSSGNAETIEYFDCLGRKFRAVSKNYDGSNILVDNVYNNKGQIFKTSEPYSVTGHENWTEYSYLNNGKVKTIESPLKSILYSYNGRTVLTQNLNTLKEQERYMMP